MVLQLFLIFVEGAMLAHDIYTDLRDHGTITQKTAENGIALGATLYIPGIGWAVGAGLGVTRLICPSGDCYVDASKQGPGTFRYDNLQGGGTCFAEGTTVGLVSGEIDITQVKKGDFVYSYDIASSKVVVDTVLASRRYISDSIYMLKIKEETIYVTGEHPFLCGWKGMDSS